MTDEERIAAIVCETGRLQSIAPQDDIYHAGLSSLKALQLLMELETLFEVALPDEEFVQARTVVALTELIQSLRVSHE